VTVDHLSLRKVLWSTDGKITISRQVNPANVVIFNLTYSGVLDLDALGIASNGALDYTSANLIIQHTSANSVVVIKGKKGTVPQAEWNADRLRIEGRVVKRAFWDNLKRQTRDHSCSRWAASFNRWRARSVISCVR
jgi:hypothetical protein